MFKKSLVLIFSILFLISCWSSIDTDTSGLMEKTTPSLSIQIPTTWEVISNDKNILPSIKDSKIELAVSSPKTVNGFANNLLILSDDLKKFTTSKDFSMLNNIWAETDYLDYKKLESKEFTFLDEEQSLLYIFEAKYNLDTPRLKFLQTAHICNQNKAFFLTIAIPTTIKDTSKYEYLLSTFECR